MNNGIEAQVGEQKTTVDIMAWLTRTALELIGQGGLGVSMDSLGEPIHNPLADSVKMMMWVPSIRSDHIVYTLNAYTSS